MATHPDVDRVVAILLGASSVGSEVALDAIGDAIGARAFSTDDVDKVISLLESAGRRVTSPREPGAAARDLRVVIAAARAIEQREGRRATVDEIATHTGLEPDAIRAALALARVMGR